MRRWRDCEVGSSGCLYQALGPPHCKPDSGASIKPVRASEHCIESESSDTELGESWSAEEWSSEWMVEGGAADREGCDGFEGTDRGRKGGSDSRNISYKFEVSEIDFGVGGRARESAGGSTLLDRILEPGNSAQ